ncbi:hypothetical protein C7S17_7132 [Burkholderia thailandensis]|nr:hypothetical protein [Burkholderia thailandensis]
MARNRPQARRTKRGDGVIAEGRAAGPMPPASFVGGAARGFAG